MSHEEPTDLDWVQLRREMNTAHPVESNQQKFNRKFAENPLVPIGCVATVAALSYGLWCFRTGKTQMSQNMMRLRIVAQGFTITAVVLGCLSASKTLV